MKKRIIIATIASVTALTGGVVALTPNRQTEAEDKPPFIVQIENHEERIEDLEVRTDDIETQVNQTTENVRVIQTETNIAPAEPVERVVTEIVRIPAPEPTKTPQPAPTPAPEPVINPYTVVKVDTLAEQNIRYADKTNYSCTYHLHNGDRYWIKSTLNTRPDYKCQYSVGDLFNETARKSHTKL